MLACTHGVYLFTKTIWQVDRKIREHAAKMGSQGQSWERQKNDWLRNTPKQAIYFKRRLSMSIADEKTLYERLGGVYNIATVVDDFIDRIMVDPRLNANSYVDEAHHRVPPAGFKYLVTEMVCWATGGPQRYSGRSMEDAHKSLLIAPQEWQAFLDDFQQTLDKFNVPQAEQEELFTLIESTREAIVIPS